MTNEKRVKPTVRLSGEDGNAFSILNRVDKALQQAGYTKEEREQYQQEATQEDYDHLLQTTMKWVEVL